MKTVMFPGQGAQFKGMGKSMFPIYPELTKRASEILGYSIEELCLEDPGNKLRLTQYTQPALYVVSALSYYKMRDESKADLKIDYLVGHSLGEYNALLAADVFDFETGLRIVRKRGELMGAAGGGGMAAVIGVQVEQIHQILRENGLDAIDLANFNTPTQSVIAGPTEAIVEAEKLFSRMGFRCVVLNVSAPFHSRYMKGAQREFLGFLKGFSFQDPKIPVIANFTARPYENGQVASTLGSQIAGSVRWTESIRHLLTHQGMNFVEAGGSTILSRMVDEIRKTEKPSPQREVEVVDIDRRMNAPNDRSVQSVIATGAVAAHPRPKESENIVRLASHKDTADFLTIAPESLGSRVFRNRYGLKYAYLSGAMYRGIASPKLVVRMAKAGFLGFLGTGGLSLKEIETNLLSVQSQLIHGEPYGMNLLANHNDPSVEQATVELYLKYGVRTVEAAAFMQVTPALVRYRLKGLNRDAAGKISCNHKIMAKVSRPEVAETFMSPAPRDIVEGLVRDGSISAEQAEMAMSVPMSHDICVEADSGGHTDGGIPSVMLPAMRRLRDECSKRFSYSEPICMGLAGGIGTPEAVAAAFMLGADFVLTGSINQCTVEAGTSDDVKSLLQEINIQDTDYAPAGDMFEMGAKIQVLKKGVFFPARANKLYSLYSNYSSLEEIPEKTQKQLQGSYFKRTFDEIWSETKSYLANRGQAQEIAKAEGNPKHKMALVFRWYFGYSSRLAFNGESSDRVNYQVHTGPALGAFNQWVKGTKLESWQNRHVDDIGKRLLSEAALYLSNHYEKYARSAA